MRQKCRYFHEPGLAP